MSNDQKEYLYDAVSQMVDRYGAMRVLDDICTMMSEDNLHEIIAAVSEFRNDSYGIDFWYGDRANFVDHEFWQ